MGAESGPVETKHEAGQKGEVLHVSEKERVMLVVEEEGGVASIVQSVQIV